MNRFIYVFINFYQFLSFHPKKAIFPTDFSPFFHVPRNRFFLLNDVHNLQLYKSLHNFFNYLKADRKQFSNTLQAGFFSKPVYNHIRS